MTSRELLDELLSRGPSSPNLPLELQRLFYQLHEALPSLELRDGACLSDLSDFMEFCRELMEELQQPALDVSTFVKAICPICFHSHEGTMQCDVDMGGAGKCECKLELRA
jgi:hypothetical protein